MFLTFHHSEVDSSARVLMDFAKNCHFLSEVINQDISKLTLFPNIILGKFFLVFSKIVYLSASLRHV